MIRSFALLFFFTASSINAFAKDAPKDSLRILFIGNSLTYTNDLPALVKEIGEVDGKNISCKTIAFPDFSLEDHWKDGKAVDEMEKRKYDFVILQQGPSALPESQALLLTYANKFAAVCKKQDSKMVLFMVWPAKARSADFDGVTASYFNAAQATNALFCPAGMAWLNVWEMNKDIPLYGPDGFHPGLDGSLVSAMTIYATLMKKDNLDFLDLKKCSWKTTISKELHSLLKMVAVNTVPQ